MSSQRIYGPRYRAWIPEQWIQKPFSTQVFINFLSTKPLLGFHGGAIHYINYKRCTWICINWQLSKWTLIFKWLVRQCLWYWLVITNTNASTSELVLYWHHSPMYFRTSIICSFWRVTFYKLCLYVYIRYGRDIIFWDTFVDY